jgi:hypothetical protein
VDLTLWPVKRGACTHGLCELSEKLSWNCKDFLSSCKLFWRCYVVFDINGVMRFVCRRYSFRIRQLSPANWYVSLLQWKHVSSLEMANIVHCWGRREIQVPKRCDLFEIGILDYAQRPETQQLSGNLLGAEKNTEKCIYRNELYISNLIYFRFVWVNETEI